jgi:hypothetical protein
MPRSMRWNRVGIVTSFDVIQHLTRRCADLSRRCLCVGQSTSYLRQGAQRLLICVLFNTLAQQLLFLPVSGECLRIWGLYLAMDYGHEDE